MYHTNARQRDEAQEDRSAEGAVVCSPLSQNLQDHLRSRRQSQKGHSSGIASVLHRVIVTRTILNSTTSQCIPNVTEVSQLQPRVKWALLCAAESQVELRFEPYYLHCGGCIISFLGSSVSPLIPRIRQKLCIASTPYGSVNRP